MTVMPAPAPAPLQPLFDLSAHHWGCRWLKPLQEEAKHAILDESVRH
jgi:hypothetical protein